MQFLKNHNLLSQVFLKDIERQEKDLHVSEFLEQGLRGFDFEKKMDPFWIW